jgi:hypothetical protein
VFKTWLEETLPSYNPNDKKIPFSPLLLKIDSEMVQVLEKMGVIYSISHKDEVSRNLASSLDNQLLFPVPCSLKPETSYLTIKITAI